MIWFSIIKKVAEVLVSGVSAWKEDRKVLRDAEREVRLKEITARGELAVYRLKSELEWDLEWAKGAQTSWKDEFLLVLWAIPLMMLFVPGLDYYADRGFSNLAKYHESAAQMYFVGWGVIFSAVFGARAAMRMMVPGKMGELIEKMGNVADDVPQDVVKDISAKIRDKFNSKKDMKK